MAEIPTTHYVKSDDVHVAYQVFGEGPFDLLFVPGFVSNVEATWRSPDLSAFFRRLASFCRVILFDKRGTGMSDRGSQIFTLEQRMHDVQAILDKVDCKQASLFGVSEGGPMALLYAATYPQRTSAMVLYGAYAKRSWAPDYPFGWNDEQWERVLNDIEQHWGTPEALNISMRVPDADQEYAERAASYFRASASPGAAAAIVRMNREIDVRHVLPATRVPTLIVHRTGDRLIDVQHARYLAHHIPGAKLIELAGEVHTPWLGNRDELLNAVEQFLTGKTRTHEPDRLLATVMFTDIVGSTERAAALGDNRWRELLEPFTPEFGRYYSFTAGGRSAWRATAYSLPLMARRERSGALARSARRCEHSVWTFVAAYTQGNANLWAKVSQESPSTLALESRHLPVRARY